MHTQRRRAPVSTHAALHHRQRATIANTQDKRSRTVATRFGPRARRHTPRTLRTGSRRSIAPVTHSADDTRALVELSRFPHISYVPTLRASALFPLPYRSILCTLFDPDFPLFAQRALHRHHPHSTLVRASIINRFLYSPPIYFGFSFYFCCFTGSGPYSPFSLLYVPVSVPYRSIKPVCSRPTISVSRSCPTHRVLSSRSAFDFTFDLDLAFDFALTRSTLRHINSRLSTLHRILLLLY